MEFHIGDKVKIAYISDCNPHNGKVGRITVLRPVNYYPNGDYSVVEQHVQAIIEYDDGTTEGVGDIYREGCGIVSPVEKVEGVKTIEFVAGYHEWNVVVDGKTVHSFDDFSDRFESENITAEQVDDLVDDLIYGWQMSFENDCDSLDENETCPTPQIWETNGLELRLAMFDAICKHYGVEQKRYRVVRDLQGGEFGTDRDLTVEQWREQAMEWAYIDDNEELEKEVENLPHKEVLSFISNIWELEFAEAVEE